MANTSETSTELDCVRNPNYFDCLPDEMLYKIFSSVPKNKFYLLAKVSHRFARICSDVRFWKNASMKGETISLFELEELISGPCLIRELDLTGVQILDGTSSNRHSDSHVTLDKLNITDIPPLMQSAILNVCRTRELIIDRATVSCQMTDAISDRTEVQVLSMDFATCNDSDWPLMTVSLDRMFKKCSELKELSLRFSKLCERQLIIVSVAVTDSLEKIFINHFTVDFEKSIFDPHPYVWNPTFCLLMVLLRRAKNLKQLGLSLNHLIEPLVFKQVALLKFLESLHFCKCDLEYNLLSEVLENLPNLKKIYFSMKCPLQEEANIKSTQNDLKNWSKNLPGKDTIISFTGLECVIEIVSYKRRELLNSVQSELF